MMKFKAILLTFFFASGAIAEDPPELEKLRETYKKEVRRVTDPISQKYIGALGRLQKSFTSSNQLDAALKVRDAIQEAEGMTKATVGSIADLSAVPPTATNVSEKSNSSGDDSMPIGGNESEPLRQWKGDGNITKKDGIEVLVIETDRVNSKKFERPFKTPDHPNGMRFHIYYRTTDYVGTGMKVKGYYNARDYLYRTIPFIADGDWHEYVYPFEASKYREAKELRFQIEVLGGSGEVEFKNLKVTSL